MTPEAVKRLENDRMVFKAWLALKLNAGMDMRLVALNMGASPEMIHRHYGHDNTRGRAAGFTNVWLTDTDMDAQSENAGD